MGLYTSGFSWTVDLGILLGLLVAFGMLDGVALAQLRTIETRARIAGAELESSRDRIKRLARVLTWSGAGFAALFLGVLILRMLLRVP